MYNDSLTDIIDIVLERLLEGDLDIILDWDLKKNSRYCLGWNRNNLRIRYRLIYRKN